VLYLQGPLPAAVPQYISGRTSYLHVRLAFHPYPQLIRAVCNPHRCGPPRPVRDASAWPWVAHVVSRLPPATMSPVKTRFPCGSGCDCLNRATEGNSPDHTPKGTLSGMAYALTLQRHASTRFQGLFHSPHRGAFHRSLTVLYAIGRCV